MRATVEAMDRGEGVTYPWQKATASNPHGDCVEMARLACGHVAVRNSRDPLGAMVGFTTAEIAAFLVGVKAGEFDHLAVPLN